MTKLMKIISIYKSTKNKPQEDKWHYNTKINKQHQPVHQNKKISQLDIIKNQSV